MKKEEKQTASSGLNMKAKEGFRILISGTDIELESIHIFTQFRRTKDSKKLQITAEIYQNEAMRKKLSAIPNFSSKNEARGLISVEIENIESEVLIPMHALSNFGQIEIDKEFNNNDVAFSHHIVTDKLKEILEVC